MRIVKPISITDSVLTSSSVLENDHATYSSTTGYALGNKVMIASLHKIFECIKQETSVVTFTATGTAIVSWTNHGLVNGRMVKFTSTASVPAGLTANTVYYVINATQNNFNISATQGGSALTTTTAGSGTITATSLVNNLDPATNPTHWLDSGSTNRWRMFDNKVQSQTTATSSITTRLSFLGYIDTITLLNVLGTTATVEVEHGADGVVYSRTIQLLADESPVVDLMTYLITGFQQKTRVVFDGIPLFANSQITLTITGPSGSTVAVGAALFGQAKDISSTGLGVEHGAKFGIDDYSVKTRDAFGNFVITERAFSDRANVTVYVNNSQLSSIKDMLTSLRATPILFVGSRAHDYLTIYGYYKNWEVDVAYPDFSVLSMEVAGLT